MVYYFNNLIFNCQNYLCCNYRLIKLKVDMEKWEKST